MMVDSLALPSRKEKISLVSLLVEEKFDQNNHFFALQLFLRVLDC
jgi:hypothetical protein